MSGLLRSSIRLLLMDLSSTVTCGLTDGSKIKIPGSAVAIFSRNRNICCSGFRHLTYTATRSSTLAKSAATPPVNTFNAGDKTNETIRITEKCKERLRQILDKKGSFLRLSVEGGGCSGFQYKFEIDNQMCADDIVISKEDGGKGQDSNSEQAGVLVVVDQTSLDLIKGSTLDYETELIRSSFRILNNPSAEHGCSCGASFNMKL